MKKGWNQRLNKKMPDYYYANPIQIEDDPLSLDESDPSIENLQIMLDGLGYEVDRMMAILMNQQRLQ